MKVLQKTGLYVFILSLSLFIATLFLNNYSLSESTLKSTIGNPEQMELLHPYFIDFYDTPTSKVEFINGISSRIDQLNNKLRAEEKWGQLVFDVKGKLFYLTKSSARGWAANQLDLLFFLTIILGIIGATLNNAFIFQGHAGIKNDGIQTSSLKSRGLLGIILGTFLILFYISLYWFPAYLAEWAMLVDPVSRMISGNEASQWFLYGFLYTIAIITMGIRFMRKYRHNKYQLVRTASVMFFQTCIAFLLPDLMGRMNLPAVDLKNMWPLDYSFFFEYRLNYLLESGAIGYFLLFWGIALFLIGVPVITYFYGKRWYCSWVCGCGGLAETAGDTFRHQSDKSLKAWKIERWMIHLVLVFAIIMTVAVVYTFSTGESSLFGILDSYKLREWYGFGIGSVFAGVVGTGFYPLMGNRTWCRFGCPLAAYLGLVQRFKSKFRITTNGGQCISCGNCSTYCEMGIDVKWYAQKGQNIVRSSCVGCGICSAVCPRGVLKLENGVEEGRFNDDNPITFGNDGFKINL